MVKRMPGLATSFRTAVGEASAEPAGAPRGRFAGKREDIVCMVEAPVIDSRRAR
jgi:hypothetical protein